MHYTSKHRLLARVAVSITVSILLSSIIPLARYATEGQRVMEGLSFDFWHGAIHRFYHRIYCCCMHLLWHSASLNWFESSLFQEFNDDDRKVKVLRSFEEHFSCSTPCALVKTRYVTLSIAYQPSQLLLSQAKGPF